MPFLFFDFRYLLFILPGLALALWAQYLVRKNFNKYVNVPNQLRVTGGEAAQKILWGLGLTDVRIEGSRTDMMDDLSDHYDPRGKVVRFSSRVYNTSSVAALAIVAHEIGHAYQDAVGFWPMRLRSALVPAANIGSNLGVILLMIGVFINLSGLAWLGVIVFAGAVLFTLVTLPVELDASRRARVFLQEQGLVTQAEMPAVGAVLNAAALTYVAALLSALGQLLYFAMLAAGTGRRDD